MLRSVILFFARAHNFHAFHFGGPADRIIKAVGLQELNGFCISLVRYTVYPSIVLTEGIRIPPLPP